MSSSSRKSDVDALVLTLIELGIGYLHSWRCEHPDRYDPCTCVEDFARDLLESEWMRNVTMEATGKELHP